MAADDGAGRAPTAEALAAIAEACLAGLPEPFRGALRAIPIRIQDWPDDAMLDEVGFDDPLELTGLFRGVPAGERDGMRLPPSEPEMIFLFRLPILLEWCERGDPLDEVVLDVLVHEIGHFFGLDEAGALRVEGRPPAD